MAWEAVIDDQGRTYYFDSVTEQSTWEKPADLLTELEKALAELHWKLYTADGGQAYYYNEKTKESTWEVPEDVTVYLKGLQQELRSEGALVEGETAVGGEAGLAERVQGEPTPSTAAISMAIEALEKVVELPEAQAVREPEVSAVVVEPSVMAEPSSVEEPLSYPETSSIIHPPAFESLDAAKAAFVNLLRTNEVDATWSFRRVMEHFIQSPTYWALPDTLLRKELFESYLANRTKAELLKENSAKEKFEGAFVAVLKNHPEIKHYTRWPTAKRLISDEPIYLHSAIPEKEKRSVFVAYVEELQSSREAKRLGVRTEALGELEEYFKSTLQLDVNSSWPEVLALILDDPRFRANRNFVTLHKMDILRMYQASLGKIHEALQTQVKALKSENYRQDRRARDEFKALLGELKQEGKLKAQTRFLELYPELRVDPRFVNLAGRNGSNPLELFWDVVDEEQQLWRIKKNILNTILLEQKFVLADHTLEAFIAHVKALVDVRVTEFHLVDDSELEAIRSELLQEAAAQREQEALQRQRQAEALAETLAAHLVRHHLLLKLTPESRVDDSEVLSTLQGLDPYRHFMLVEGVSPSTRQTILNRCFAKVLLGIKEAERKVVAEANPVDADRLLRFESRKRPHSEVADTPVKKEVELDY